VIPIQISCFPRELECPSPSQFFSTQHECKFQLFSIRGKPLFFPTSCHRFLFPYHHSTSLVLSFLFFAHFCMPLKVYSSSPPQSGFYVILFRSPFSRCCPPLYQIKAPLFSPLYFFKFSEAASCLPFFHCNIHIPCLDL